MKTQMSSLYIAICCHNILEQLRYRNAPKGRAKLTHFKYAEKLYILRQVSIKSITDAQGANNAELDMTRYFFCVISMLVKKEKVGRYLFLY